MAATLPRRIDTAKPERDRTRDEKSDEQKLLGYLDELQQEGERARERWAPKAERERDIKLYRGQVGPKSGEAFFKANIVQTFVDRMVQQLTDNRPILRVESRKIGLKAVALTLQKAADAVWEESRMQRQTFKMAHQAAITRSAGLYTGFDPGTDEIVLEVVKGSQVIFDPAVEEAALLNRAEYLAVDRIRPCSELVYKFPGRGGFVKPDANVTLDPATQSRRTVLSPLTDIVNGRVDAGDTLGRAHVWEWHLIDRQRSPDGKALFPNGRQIFRTKDMILWDGPKHYWDAEHPIDWFDWIVDPEHPWGLSAPNLLMELQLAFNQLGAGLVENQILSNFLTVIADHDSLDPLTWKKLQAITSSIILRKRSRNAMAPTITPPQAFGQDKIALLRWIFTIAQLLTGVTDVTLGETPGSLQSGQAIEGLVEGANLGTRSRASRMEDFFGRVGQKLLARIFQFWPSEKVISLVGPSADAMEYVIKRSEFFVGDDGKPLADTERVQALKWHRFLIQPGSSMAGTRLKRGQLMKDLVLLGASSREELLAEAGFQNPKEMLDRAKKEFLEFSAAGFVPPAAAKTGK